MADPQTQTGERASPKWDPASRKDFVPKITSIFDFNAEALGELKLWLEQNPPNIPIRNVSGYQQQALVTGHVSSGGSVLAGSGFSVAHPGTGNYLITLNNPFSSPPIVAVTPFGTAMIAGSAAANGQFGVQFADNTGAALDVEFQFIVTRVV